MDIFENVIGYDGIKIELSRIVDILIDKEKYERLGVKEPHGLLLYGSPGVGKTLFAREFISATNRKCYTCRKSKTTGLFVSEIKKTFDEAVKNEPSIVFLDDLDKYSNSDKTRTNTEEFVTIQSCIDEIKDKSVYVIATANDIFCLPESFTRPGRFDNLIEVKIPENEDSLKIIEHFLSNKFVKDSITKKNASRILRGKSTAEIETIINNAAIRAGFENKKNVEFDDIVNAYIRECYEAPETTEYDNLSYIKNISYHEAGHAVVAEILEPGVVNVVSVLKGDGSTGGITAYDQKISYFFDVKYMEERIMCALGGKAATDLIFGKSDPECNDDLHSAFRITTRLVDDYCSYGFDSFNHCNSSNELKDRIDQKVSQEVSKYYANTKEILANNKELLDAIAKELEEKKLLTFLDIERIKNSIKIAK